MDNPDLTLNLTDEGQCWWAMVSSPDREQQRDSAKLRLASIENKGLGVVASSSLAKGSVAFSNNAVASVLMHWQESELCMHCWQLISKSAKCLPACRHLRYCSATCLQANEHYIAVCGAAVNAIVSAASATPLETQLLALNLLYRLSTTSSADEVAQILSLFALHSALPEDVEDVLVGADIFHRILTTEGVQLLGEVSWFLDFDRCRARTLFRVMRLNAQPMHIYGAKRYSVLLLLSGVARVNHNCVPNCELLLQIGEEAEADGSGGGSEHYFARAMQARTKPSSAAAHRRQLRVCVVAVTDIPRNGELTVSYLSNLYEGREGRQHFLSEGFYFRCACARCTAEEAQQTQLTEGGGAGQRLEDMLTLLTGTNGSSSSVLDMPRAEELLLLCEGIMTSIKGSNGSNANGSNANANASSTASVYHACLLVIDDYQSRFRRLQAESAWADYITFGLLFFRAGKLMCDVWAAVQCAWRPARLDLMTKVCLHAALTAKPFLEHRAALGLGPDKVSAMVRGALAMSVEAAVLIDTVYLTNEQHRERESEVGTDDGAGATLGDSWHYLRLLRDKAVRVRSYLRTAAERINEPAASSSPSPSPLSPS